MKNPFIGIESFLDSNIESGDIWYYILGLIALAGYFVIKSKFG
jgi:hypothetical protein